MIVTVRFRDVSYEELQRVHPAPPFDACDKDEWEQFDRGRDVEIVDSGAARIEHKCITVWC